MPNPISVVIHTQNAEATLKDSLESVKWADEIIVMDMESTDDTLSIAKRFTKNIYTVPSLGFADPARNKAISLAKNPWILVLDADETVPKTLKLKLLELTDKGLKTWKLPRKNIVFGKWMKHTGGWPDYQVRFFPKGKVSWSDKVHQHPTIVGEWGEVTAKEELALVHMNYLSIESFLERLNRYTSLEVKSRSLIPTHSEMALEKGSEEFIRRFFLMQGYKDGVHGLHLSLLQSFYELIVVMKQWEKEGFPERKVDIERFIEEKNREFRYWNSDYHYNKSNDPLSKIYWKIRRKFKI